MIRNVYILTCTLIGWINGVASKKNPVCFEVIPTYDRSEIDRLFSNRLSEYNAEVVFSEEYEDDEIQMVAVGVHPDDGVKVTIQVETTIMQ